MGGRHEGFLPAREPVQGSLHRGPGGGRPQHPAQTSHVLIASDGGRLKLAATNLEIAITSWIGAKVEEEGAITVPARLLVDFVNSLPNERIEMTLPPARASCASSAPATRPRVAGMDANDFPPIPAIEDGAR